MTQGLTTSLCNGAPLTGQRAPDLVHLLPMGQIKGRDGRRWTLEDAKAVVSASMSEGVDLVIDYEHQVDDPKRRTTGPVPAAGWLRDLMVKPDGIWGRVVWTQKARNMIEAREYRYLSPVITHYRDGRIVRLKGASLVHRPNLELTALSSQEDTMSDTPSDLGRIATALNLSGEADADQIIEAINTLSDPQEPDPAKYIPVEAVKDILSDRRTLQSELSESKIDSMVNDAMQNGYISPGMRDWAVSLCSRDPDAFEDFISSTPPAFAHLSREIVPSVKPSGQVAAKGGLAESICAQLGLGPDALD